MTKKTIATFEVQVKGKNISVVAKDTEKLGKSIDKTGKEADQTSKQIDKLNKNSNSLRRGLHGAAGMSSNATKNFSKMNQGMGGSGGIVAAYATLAANVFAASAAFNALRSSAAFEQLVEGFTFMANEAGRSVDLIVGRLKDITGQALSTEQALQGAALALSAGFKTDQLETLTKVARGASLALGRNLGDAFDRLTRGAIKLEPEILDELGIMVRLDRAVENYAATLGKGANELTQFERQTAFLNAINEQGIKKYGALADAVDTNPYDRLAAAFATLTKSGLSLINTFLVPLIEFLAKSVPAMIGALVLFASTIVGQMIPALGAMASNAREAANAQRDLADEAQKASRGVVASARKTVLGVTDGSKAFQKFQGKVKTGTQTQLDLDKQLTNAQARLRRAQAKAAEGNKKEAKLIKLKTEAIKKQIAAIKALKGATDADVRASQISIQTAQKAQRAGFRADALESIGGQRGFGGFSEAFKQTKGYGKLLKETTPKTAGFAKVLGSVGNGFRLAGAGASFFGFALVNAIPLIGQITFAIGLLTQAVSFLKDKVMETNEGFETLAKLRETQPEIFNQLQFRINQGEFTEGEKIINQYSAAAGVLGERLDAVKKSIEGADAGAGAGFFASIVDAVAGSAFDTETLTDGTKVTETLKNSIDANLIKEVTATSLALLEDQTEASAVAREEFTKSLAKAFNVTETQVIPLLGMIETREQLALVVRALVEADNKVNSFDQSVTNLETGLKESEKAFSKFFLKAAPTTEFDDVIKQLSSLDNELKNIKEEPEVVAQLLEDNLGQSLEAFGVNVENATTRIPTLIEDLKELQSASITLQDDLKTLAVKTKELSQFQNLGSEGSKAALEATNEQSQLRLDLIDKELKLIESLDEKAKARPEIQNRINKLTAEQLSLTSQLKSEQEILFESLLKEENFKMKLLNLDKQITSERNKQRKILQEASNFLIFGDKEETNIQRLRREKAERKEALRIAQEVRDIEVETAQLTANLEAAKVANALMLGQMEMTTARAILANLAKQRDLQIQIANAKNNTVIAENALADLIAQGAIGDGLGLQITAASTLKEKFNVLNVVGQELVQSLNQIDAASGAALSQILLLADAFASLDKTIATFTENFNAQIAADGFNLAEKLGLTTEQLAQGVAGIMITMQAVTALGQTYNAISAQRVKGIDREIEAEKRRDGKSAASQAKIQALEKKKLALQKKQFEIDKKMKLAQAVMSTAVGITQVIGIPFIGPALAAMVAAVGAAQIALISRMSFEGGSASAAAAPTNLSIGQRSSNVDVAQRATAGELSYLRGGSTAGQDLGGAGVSFPGAAMGRRGYADGGVVVGERGPEVITPATPVDITPNYALGGQPTNVNFTINALDAAGVEDVLMNQRGNLIRMIRDAANENGERFLETVDTQAYGGNK